MTSKYGGRVYVPKQCSGMTNVAFVKCETGFHIFVHLCNERRIQSFNPEQELEAA